MLDFHEYEYENEYGRIGQWKTNVATTTTITYQELKMF